MNKKSVVLIGDSIRLSYQPTVQQALADCADVWGPEENGGHSVNVLIQLPYWILNRQPTPDIIHINAGLHDLKTVYYGGRENVVPLEHYRANVATILRTIRGRTNARVIWATTTPVNDVRCHIPHAQWNYFDRYDADVIAYSAAARDVCRQLNVPVNDLHALVVAAGADRLLTEDGVHFNDAGQAQLGATVASAIRHECKH